MMQAQLFARREVAVSSAIGHTTQVFVRRALNAEIWDADGKRYIDFAAGIAVVNTGHCHPRVIAAVQKQLEEFTHTCFQVALYEQYVELAERLNALVPLSGPVKTAFFTTGAEATENAIKVAYAATRRSGIIAFTGAFHGRTMLAMNMTGKTVPYKKGIGPVQPNIWHVPFPAPELGVSVSDSIRQLEFVFKADIDPSQIAAIIIEPVQGEGGFHQAPPELMRHLRSLCDTHGIVLIADEVQTGFGRTGRLFAMEHYDIEPDVICVAKGLGGGFPLSGVVGRAPLMDAAPPGGLGGTYAGSPVSCAAALAVLDVIADEKLVDRANAIGASMRKRLEAMRQRNALTRIAEIRGPGAMVAFDVLAKDSQSHDPARTRAVIARAAERGLILLSCGTTASSIRLLPPLTISDAMVEEGMDLLETALAE